MKMGTPPQDGERGSTIVELIVGMAMGTIVMAGLTLVIITTIHSNARVDARVEATQNARLTVTKIMEELHSACVSPQIAPVKEGSSGTKLIFWHAAAGESAKVQPIPVKSEIVYENGGLYQLDKAKSGGTGPEWTFASTATKQTLLERVTPVTGSTSIFGYFRYENGALSGTPLATPLSKASAEETILVTVDLEAEPRSQPVADASSDAVVSNSATLRLTPPSFNEGATALPCQ